MNTFRNPFLRKSLAALLSTCLVSLSAPAWAFSIKIDLRKPPKKAQPPSRDLSQKEMKKLKGKAGENPYTSGIQRWSVMYNGVDVLTGNFTTSATDLSFEGNTYGIPVAVTRSYSANNAEEGPFGKGWTLSVDMRTTAGGLLKKSGGGDMRVPVTYQELPSGQVTPKSFYGEGVMTTDASGNQEVVQKDVDGVLSNAPWDKNIYRPVYQDVVVGSDLYQIMVSNTIITPEGTTYTYAKRGEYVNGGMQPAFGGSSPPSTPSNILKITSITDRHGNITTFSYNTTTGQEAYFVKPNGLAKENKLTSVTMPNGRSISFTWGNVGGQRSVGGVQFTSQRITEADGGNGFEVLYGYGPNSANLNLTTSQTPGGKITTYEYGSATFPSAWSSYNPEFFAGSLLNSITDPRGLVTTIDYHHAWAKIQPYNQRIALGGNVYMSCVSVWRISHPNGVKTYYYHSGLDLSDPQADSPFNDVMANQNPQFEDRIGNHQGTVLNWADLDVYASGTSNPLYHVDMRTAGYLAGATIVAQPATVWQREYSTLTYDLIKEKRFIYPQTGGSLPGSRLLSTTAIDYQTVETTSTYNFQGNPLSQTVTETTYPISGSALTASRTIEHAYHGYDKMYQRKATKDPSDRLTYTEYFDRDHQDVGKRGQVYRVYDPKWTNGYSNSTGTGWRDTIVPSNTSCYSAQFSYDAKGRVTTVDKLQSATLGTPSSYTYVTTKTEYLDNNSFGQVNKVTEDFGTGKINRITETTAWDAAGRPTSTVDGAGKVFETTYLDLDGRVSLVKRTDTTPDVDVVSYTYGTTGLTNGVPTQVADELSGETQAFTYISSGGGIGQIATVTSSGAKGSTVTYTYNSSGDRETAHYQTLTNNSKWKYKDYIRVGSPDAPSRVFQTLNKQAYANNAWSDSTEELHYAFDSAARMTNCAFAQTPQSGQSNYNSLAASRAHAFYEYHPSGLMTRLEHWWQKDLSQGAYTTETKLRRVVYGYDVDGNGNPRKKNLRTTASYQNGVSGSWVQQREEQYGYDSSLDFLTSASYDGGSTSRTWAYDAAGNRSSDSGNSGTWTYDDLNRMSASPNTSYSNDILGNRTALDTTGTVNDHGYTWDILNRMASHTKGGATTEFLYRADGMRVKKGYSTGSAVTHYIYDGQMPVEEFFAGNALPRNYLQSIRYGLGARGIDYIEREQSNNSLTVGFPIYDGHGNMIATLARASSNSYSIADERSYDVWGGVRTGNATGEPNARYVANLGHLQDDESGLIYMRARYYEPSSGRFVSEDRKMDGSNWFAYCGNSPTNAADPSGCEWGPVAWLGTGLLFYGSIRLLQACLAASRALLPITLFRAARSAQQAIALMTVGLVLAETSGGSMMTGEIALEFIAGFGLADMWGSLIVRNTAHDVAGLAVSGKTLAAKACIWSAFYTGVCWGYLFAMFIDEAGR